MTSKKNSWIACLFSVTAVLAFIGYGSTARAATFTLSTTGDVNTAGNWTPGVGGPPGPGQTGEIPSGFTGTWSADLSNGTPDELQVTTGGILQIHYASSQNVNLVLDGGRFRNSANRSYSGQIFVRNDSYIGGTSANLTLSGVIADHADSTGKLIKDTAASVALSGAAKTYTGGTDISAGILTVSGTNVTGTGDVNLLSGGTLRHTTATLVSDIIADGGTIDTVANYNMNAPIVLKSDSTISTSAAAATLSGIISDNGGSPGKLIKAGSGRYTLSNASNTFSGGTEIQAGTLRGSATGSFGSGGVVVKNGATAEIFTTATQSGGVTLESGGTAVVYSSSDAITAEDGSFFRLYQDNRSTSNPVDISGTVTMTTPPQASNTSQDFNGVISGSGKLVYDGTNDLDQITDLRAANTFLGGFDVDAGIVRLESAGRLPDVGTVTVKSGAILNYTGVSDSIGGLAGTGNVELGGNTLTVLEGIAPGLSPGTLTIDDGGSLVLDAGTTNVFELGPLSGTNDQVVLSGLANLTLGGILQIDGTNLDIGQYVLFDLNGGSVSGAFSSIQMFGDGEVIIQGGDVILNVTNNTPEPSSLLLCSLALVGATARRKRLRRTKSNR